MTPREVSAPSSNFRQSTDPAIPEPRPIIWTGPDSVVSPVRVVRLIQPEHEANILNSGTGGAFTKVVEPGNEQRLGMVRCSIDP